jgi:hypothetical protein
MRAEAPAPPLRDSGVATVDSSVHSTAQVAGRPVPLDAWAVGPASRVPDSTDRRRGGSRSVAAPCRGAIPVAVRIGAAADGNCHRVVPDRGRRRRRVGLTTRRAGLGTRRRRRPSAERRCRALGVFLAGWARATIWRDEVDRRARGHRRLGGRGRFGLRCRRLVVGFLGARPAELFPQCVVAVGHCTISFSVRRRGCRPLSSINYTGSALSHTATRVRRDRPANTLRGLR